MAAISDRAWSTVTPADYADAQDYCSACLIDSNPAGQEKIMARCKLPVKEPGGALNRNAVHAAAAALAGARTPMRATPEEKRQAARRLVTYYGQLEEEPPPSLKALAGL